MRSPKKYLHLYNTQAEQTADYYGSAYEEPWVSFEKQHETVAYNKKPRLVILTSASDSKTYDGTMLTNDTITVSGEGFKEGDGASYNFTLGPTLVSTFENYFTYNLYEHTDAREYDIRTVFGTLEVVDGTGEGEEPVDPEFVVTMEADDDTYKLGDTVTFSITASNIYDSAETIYLQTIDGVTLAQTTFENIGAGGSIETTATYAIIEPDILAGEFTASVTAYVGNVQAEADWTISTESPNPHMVIRVNTLTEPPEGYFQLGDTIDYEVTVTNDGNLLLTEIEVSSTEDEMTLDSLFPGASETRQFSHEVTEEDVAATEVNVAWTGTANNHSLEPTIVDGDSLLWPTE